MRVTQAELARYRRQLAAQAQAARAYVLARLKAGGISSSSVAEAREATIAAVSDAIGVYGDQAQAIAADLFDEVMEAEGLKPRATVYEGVIDEAAMAEKVRYYAGQLAQGKLARYTRDVGDLAAYYVRRSAYECMVANCVGQKVAFARVPTGRETCGWCFMLASRGFDYATERSAAGGSHEGCDCVIVPGVKGRTRIAGYEPDGMARRWGDCVDTAGGTLTRAETTAMWEALPKEERERMRKRWGSGARERFHTRESTRAARAEAERRDPRWLYRGEGAGIDKSAISNKAWKRKSEHERSGLEDLNKRYGFMVTVLPEDSPISNIDMLMGGQLWELKTVEGAGGKLDTRLEDGVMKWKKQHDAGNLVGDTPRIVVDNRFGDALDSVIEEKIKKNQEFFRNENFNLALLIMRNGRLKWIRNE